MAELSEEYETAKALVLSIAEWYVKQVDTHSKMNAVVLTRLSVLSLSQYAATLGVDVGMTEDQFVNVCRANFQEAYDKAPKFG